MNVTDLREAIEPYGERIAFQSKWTFDAMKRYQSLIAARDSLLAFLSAPICGSWCDDWSCGEDECDPRYPVCHICRHEGRA